MKMNDWSLDEALEMQQVLRQDRKKRILWYWYVCASILIFLLCLTKTLWIISLIDALALIIAIIIRSKKHRLEVRVWFGLPGSGKSTIAAHLVKKAAKKDIPSYTNVPIVGGYKLDPDADLGIHDIRDASVIIDEAGLCWNNRNTRGFPKTTIEFLKLHRHYGCSVDVFSQSYNDMDITVRRLAYHFYLVRRGLIPGMITAYPIRRNIGINDMTKEICDEYKLDPPILRPFTAKRIWGKKYWHMFDSYDAPELAHKDFEQWTSSECGQDGSRLKADIAM